MKLHLTLKTALFLLLAWSTFSMAAQPVPDSRKIVLLHHYFDTQAGWRSIFLEQSERGHQKGIFKYNVFVGGLSYENTSEDIYTKTLSFPSPALTLTSDDTTHLFYITGSDFVSISSDASSWYTTTRFLDVPFVKLGSDAGVSTQRLFSTSEIPRKPAFIPPYIVLGSDAVVQD